MEQHWACYISWQFLYNQLSFLPFLIFLSDLKSFSAPLSMPGLKSNQCGLLSFSIYPLSPLPTSPPTSLEWHK